MRAHLHAERAQERLAQPAAGHARGGLARGGALEDVAHVRLLVLLRAHEVGVSGARQVDLLDLLVDRPRAHALLPVGVVAVGDLQRDGLPSVRPWRTPPVTSAASRSIFIRPPRPWPSWRRAMSALRSSGRELDARRQPLDDARQAGAVRLAGGDQAERHRA